MAVTEERVQSFRAYLQKIMNYQSATNLLSWDARTHMPKKGVDARSQALGTLYAEVFRMTTSDEMAAYIEQLTGHPGLDPVLAHSVEECRREYDRSKKIPADRYEAFVNLTVTAESAWQVAREASDFSQFQPYLEKIVAMKREFIGYWGYEGHPYNTLLDQYEPGLTVDTLDALFANVREQTVALLSRIEAAPQPDASFLTRYFDPAKQREFSLFILKEIGYDMDAGDLAVTTHPFATTIGPGDVRITTRFLPNFFNSAIFGTIHECGHALYEQNLGEDLQGTPMHDGTSMGIHESQSRFWENVVGRSREFWERYYGDLQTYFPEALADVTLDAFYAAINQVHPSFIRVEADELTYNLHIMIRYELEKALMAGELEVANLPQAWREKMKAYLGIEPPNDAKGVLQDVHWAGGDFGYFPSYSLGNLYAAQFTHAMEKDLPDFKGLIARGEFAPIRDWLVQNIHRHGKMKTPAQLLQDVTGEQVDARYLMAYFQRKFGAIYGI